MKTPYVPLLGQFTYETVPAKQTAELPWLYVFLANAVIYTVIYAYQLADGGLLQLRPFNSAGQQCGLHPATLNFPYLYYVSPNESLSYSVCVSECPSRGVHFECLPNERVLNCEFSYESSSGVKIVAPYNSVRVWDSLCYPADSVQPPDSLGEALGEMLSYCWLSVFPVLLIFVCFLLLYYFSFGVVCASIVLSAGALLYAGASLHETEGANFPVLGTLAVLIYMLTGLYIGLAVYLRDRLQLAAEALHLGCCFLLKQSSAVIAGVLGLVCCTTAVLLGGVLLMATYAPPVSLPTALLLLYELLSGVWFAVFWLSFFQMSVSVSLVKWRFTPSDSIPHWQVLPSTVTTVKFHLGQVSCVSLLHAVVITCLIALHCARNEDSAFLVAGVLYCILAAVQGGFMLLHRYVLANLAYCDHSFWEALQAAYRLLANNPLRTLAYEWTTKLLSIAVAMGVGFLSILLSFAVIGSQGGAFVYGYAVFVCLGVGWMLQEVLIVSADTTFLCLLQAFEDGRDRPDPF